MDSYTFNQLERIEKKLDLIIENTIFNSTDIKNTYDENQTYFPWYHELKQFSSLDVIE